MFQNFTKKVNHKERNIFLKKFKNNIRYSLVGIWDTIIHKNFIVPKLNFITRTISIKENFKETMK